MVICIEMATQTCLSDGMKTDPEPRQKHLTDSPAGQLGLNEMNRALGHLCAHIG